jgi:zinc/manganese transport system substrate-binding protein
MTRRPKHPIFSRRTLLAGAPALLLASRASFVSAQSDSAAFPEFPPLASLPEIPERADGPLKVMATTGIIGDMVAQIGGPRLDAQTILPANADPHEFEPAPQDIAKVSGAAVIFVHGLGLDSWSEAIIENADGDFAVVTVTDGIEAVERTGNGGHEQEGDDQAHDHQLDPHVWFDPTKAAQMAANIAAGLTAADPDGTDSYAARLAAYQQQLTELDQQIAERVALIPEENRKIVTNHEALGYYADRYGLVIVGTVIPGISAGSEPSAKEIAELLEIIEREGVKAIFAENTSSPGLAEELATQAGISVVDTLYTDSLGEPGSGAETYIGLMQFDTRAIVEALTVG